MTEHRAQVAELLADYQRSRAQLASVQRELAAITASAENADRTVTATAGPRGTLTGLVIAEDAYRRYTPAELAAQIVRTAGAAAVKALTGAGEVLAPVLPGGTDPQALLLGTGDLSADEIAPPPPKPDPDDDVSFEEQSWVEEQEWPKPR
ncbi:YbaB/EbfC family nucleoid-associated protein [Amycolatopsis nigrescens]|uniref:YbaB/EbfC family nucleoid-associated protein n=1 Tax=Amycolatopsis nigrescens TaxID=381445 RepID=UPI00039BDBE1|nr:YbaB/EbfC family nucleoid-associated protein [Amycolatopsis nigrescens]